MSADGGGVEKWVKNAGFIILGISILSCVLLGLILLAILLSAVLLVGIFIALQYKEKKAVSELLDIEDWLQEKPPVEKIEAELARVTLVLEDLREQRRDIKPRMRTFHNARFQSLAKQQSLLAATLQMRLKKKTINAQARSSAIPAAPAPPPHDDEDVEPEDLAAGLPEDATLEDVEARQRELNLQAEKIYKRDKRAGQGRK